MFCARFSNSILLCPKEMRVSILHLQQFAIWHHEHYETELCFSLFTRQQQDAVAQLV
jgi:hypothetical protein